MAVRAEIEFLAPGTERPFTYARETPSGAEPDTARFVSHAVEIRDLRGGEVLRLDEHGGTLGLGRRGCDASMTTIAYASATTPKAPRSSRAP